MKKMLKHYIFAFFFLTSCTLFPPKPSNELEVMTDDVLKKKEGIDIRITPIDPKSKN